MEIPPVLPCGFTPYLSVSDGNCLFSSVSICLFGDTTRATALRFGSRSETLILQHYLELVCILPSSYNVMIIQFSAEIATDDDALQFLSTVAANDDVFVNRPSGDRNEILKYSIESELLSTPKMDSYSGKSLQ